MIAVERWPDPTGRGMTAVERCPDTTGQDEAAVEWFPYTDQGVACFLIPVYIPTSRLL